MIFMHFIDAAKAGNMHDLDLKVAWAPAGAEQHHAPISRLLHLLQHPSAILCSLVSARHVVPIFRHPKCRSTYKLSRMAIVVTYSRSAGIMLLSNITFHALYNISTTLEILT